MYCLKSLILKTFLYDFNPVQINVVALAPIPSFMNVKIEFIKYRIGREHV